MAKPKAELPVLAFPSLDAWDAWLAAQPDGAPGLWLKLAKKGCATPSVSKAEAIEGALRHGWIDGQIGRFDDDWFLTRFTPRTATSSWSAVNCAKAEALIGRGRMAPRGLAEVEKAKADGRWAAAYPPQSKAEVPADLKAALDAAPAARKLFDELSGANRYAVLYRVRQAKSAEARAKKIATLVGMLARGETLHPHQGKG
jgi:uncharacterized protein YdeI (YjbR/CyaY-like superfamily)